MEPKLKIGNFQFPESRDPELDGKVIRETLEESKLSEELGMDMLWLAEHHFDGCCAYVDPVSYAAALATATSKIGIGFAVAQMSMHHPVRFAEQMAVIDQLSKGRLTIGLGRGTAYNVYDYQGYGIDPGEAQARFEEAEDIMMKAWQSDRLDYEGKFWNLRIPAMRPRPFQRPYPPIVRASSSPQSLVDIASRGLPFMMDIQTTQDTRDRFKLYRDSMLKAGHSEEKTAQNIANSWAWRNVYVAETDAEAERDGIPFFHAMNEHRQAMRARVYKEQGLALKTMSGPTPIRYTVEHGVVCGSPETVAEKLRDLNSIVGGLIVTFRMGPMPSDVAQQSMSLFMNKVVPELQTSEVAVHE